MHQRYSIRQRLARRTLACMILILLIIGIAAVTVARHESEEIFSARLATSARVLESLVAHQVEKATIEQPVVIPLPAELAHADDDSPTRYGHPYETKIAFQVWNNEGRLLAKSASAPDAAMSPLVAGFSSNDIDGVTWQVFTLKSGDTWVQAAEKDEVRQEMIAELGTSVLAPMFAGGILMLVAVNLVLSTTTTSLRALADGISSRDPASLAQIDLPDMPDELTPIVSELNSLLQRMKMAIEREQRFIDAAAHEIRTPIAAIQLHVQNALRSNTPQERENSLALAQEGLRRTTKLAEQLLAFSRLAAKTDIEMMQKVSLNQICHEVISVQEPLLEQKGQSIGLDAPQECVIMGDPYKLQQLLHNLIDNASQYGTPRGDIEVAVTRQGKSALLQVSNEGEPVPDAEMERIFTPYYRLPGRGGAGSGLGLSIVKEIAQLHKAKVTVGTKAHGQGCVISVTFPLLSSGVQKSGGQPTGEIASDF